jgi:hypothetical protein
MGLEFLGKVRSKDIQARDHQHLGEASQLGRA